MSPQAASQMLKVVGVISFVFSLLFIAGAFPPLSGGVAIFYDAIEPGAGAAGDYGTLIRLLSAVLGGIFASWCVFLIMVVAPAVRDGDENIRRASIIAILTWFTLDSAGSVAAGFALNVVGNSIYLILLLTPLLLVRQEKSAPVAA